MNKNLATYLTFKMPKCSPATTRFDHEEWARFYLELLTDSEYQKFNVVNSVYNSDHDMRPWNDSALLQLARMHVEAAKLLKELDNLHDGEEE